MTKNEVEDILKSVEYRGWNFVVHQKNDMLFLQITFFAPSTVDPTRFELQKCRWWLLDTDRGPHEIVRTAYKAVEAAVLHEMQEEFRYRGQAVMDPHRPLA